MTLTDVFDKYDSLEKGIAEDKETLDSTKTDITELEASLAERTGKFDEARSVLESALRNELSQRKTTFTTVEELLEKGDLSEAYKHLTGTVEEPDSTPSIPNTDRVRIRVADHSVYGIDASTGTELWRNKLSSCTSAGWLPFPLTSMFNCRPLPVHNDRFVFVPKREELLVLDKATGEQLDHTFLQQEAIQDIACSGHNVGVVTRDHVHLYNVDLLHNMKTIKVPYLFTIAMAHDMCYALTRDGIWQVHEKHNNRGGLLNGHFTAIAAGDMGFCVADSADSKFAGGIRLYTHDGKQFGEFKHFHDSIHTLAMQEGTVYAGMRHNVIAFDGSEVMWERDLEGIPLRITPYESDVEIDMAPFHPYFSRDINVHTLRLDRETGERIK